MKDIELQAATCRNRPDPQASRPLTTMNKTLMLVICDFLLLSMLALARFDSPEDAAEAVLDATAISSTSEEELIRLLEESLQMEQASRSSLNVDLDQTRADLEQQAAALAARESALEATRLDLQTKSSEAAQLAQTTAELEAERTRLAEEKAELQALGTELSEKFETTRSQLENANKERLELTKNIGAIENERSVAAAKLSQTEEDLVARELALAEREAELRAAREEAARLARERAELDRALQVAQAERNLLEQNLASEQAEKDQLRQEKEAAFARAEALGRNVSELGQNVSQLGQGVSQLGEGVSTIATTSEAIQKEIIEDRPQTMSEIFTRFQDNRSRIEFTAREKSLLSGQGLKTYTSHSILLDDDTCTHYLVTHSDDTPFELGKRSGLSAVDLTVTLGTRQFPIDRVAFLATDPRICFIPLPAAYVEASGLETFELARQPERWEEAVLVKNDESNFGRTEFRRLTRSADFLKMDRPELGQLFANFACSRGDLVFTKRRFIALIDSRHAVVLTCAAFAQPASSPHRPAKPRLLKDRLRNCRRGSGAISLAVRSCMNKVSGGATAMQLVEKITQTMSEKNTANYVSTANTSCHRAF